MPPKKKFSRKQIADTAFEVVRKQGWPNLSARSIAAALESSTMPIYSYLASMEAIEEEIRKRALDLLLVHQAKKYTENPFLNLAVGYIAFARQEANLFRFLFLERPKGLDGTETDRLRRLTERIPEAAASMALYFGGVSDDELDDVSMKSWIFTHGLAMAVSNGLLGPVDDREIVRLLGEAGKAFVEWKSGT
jgi:AcrR family transcriptional regulator